MSAGAAAALAALPIAVVLAGMVGLRWSAARAGVVGLAVTVTVAVAFFGFGRVVLADLGVGGALGGAAAEAVFTAVTILWIIVPALAIHAVQVRTGATDVLRLAMGRLSSDPRIVALLVAWFFALFMEGAAGFGASVALAAPFLVSAGFRRVDAVTAALVGHAAGVSFGAVGTPVIPQIAATGLTGLELSRATGIYHTVLGWVLLAVLMALVTRASRAGGDAGTRGAGALGWPVLAGVAFFVPFFVLAQWVGPELPTLGGALLGGLVFVFAIRAGARRRLAALPAGPVADPPISARSDEGLAVVRAGAPYLVLVGLVLVTRLVPGLRETLAQLTWEWELAGQFSGSVAPLYHPGTMLLGGLLGGVALQRVAARDLRAALAGTARQLVPVTVALLAMLGLSRTMVHAGMTEQLALAGAAVAGGAWPLFAPVVGALGTFVTGSATASNILFTDLQQAAAADLELPVAPIVGAQGFGAAVGNIVCPHNVVAASATVALHGREGEVLRRTLWVAGLYAALGGALAMLLVS